MEWWEVYLLLKLDAFCGLVLSFTITLGVLAMVSLIVFIVSHDSSMWCAGDVVERQATFQKMMRKILIWIIPLFFMSLTVNTLIPNTKQAAAMWVIPRLTKSEFMTNELPKEAKELYSLFKAWLMQQAKKE